MQLGRFNRSISKCMLARIFVCALCVCFSWSLSAQSRSLLKMNPNAYTGKRAWWFNYQYFPELTIFGQSDDTVPDVVHRLAFYVNGGYAGLNFSGTQAATDKKFGLGAGFRYNYFVSPHWGFRTGLGFDYMSSSAHMGEFKDEFVKTDQESDQIRYNYSLSSIDEDYNFYMIDLPIELVCSYKRIMAGLGIKLAFPVSVAYTQTARNVSTQAYFPQYDVTVDDSWVLACGNYETVEQDNKFVASPIVFLGTADVEYMIPVNKKYSIGIGAYIDYSLSSTFSFRKNQQSSETTDQKSVIGTTNEAPVSLVGNSMLSGMKDDESNKVISHIKYMNAGLRISFNINTYGPPKPRTKPY